MLRNFKNRTYTFSLNKDLFPVWNNQKGHLLSTNNEELQPLSNFILIINLYKIVLSFSQIRRLLGGSLKERKLDEQTKRAVSFNQCFFNQDRCQKLIG